jgi:hypothetical protein
MLPENRLRARVRCLTRRHVQRLRRVSARVARPSRTIFEKEFCQEAEGTCCGFGSEVLPQISRRVLLRAPAGRTLRRKQEELETSLP